MIYLKIIYVLINKFKMGIPKYFKHVISNFDELTIDTDSNNTINIEYLYFDMNCLIHPCVRKVCKENESEMALYIKKDKEGNLDDSIDTKFESLIYNEINDYLDKLIKIVNPTKMVYLAIDGVAPRAKMEQQRIRRYRTVKEKEMIKEVYIKNGKHYLEDFDTNCITPGTIFMYKLSNQLKKYILKKSIEYKGITFVLDDCQNIGEGEHKIFKHLRNMNEQGCNKVCIYGLDADLIMLSLCSQKHIYLLREIVHFGNHKNKKDGFLYFDVNGFKNQLFDKMDNIMNEGLDEKLKIEKQRIIIDYITLCFLIGNDFLPSIVGIDLSTESVDNLIKIYINIFKVNHNYLIDNNNKINFIFLKQIFSKLFSEENEYLSKYQAFIDNKRPWLKFNDNLELELEKINYYPYYNPITNIKLGSDKWIDQYYNYYMDINNIHKNKTFINEICKCYIEGLQWNLEYYINDCPSYSWYYPYRASPCLRELVQYMSKRVYPAQFEKDIRYSPLEQLAIVLPKKSSTMWAKEYKKIVDKDIILQSYYPIDYQLDTLNNMYLHECNPILMTIDDNYIREIFKNIKLTESEKARNIESGVFSCNT